MSNLVVLTILTLGLLFIQVMWIVTEPRKLSERFTKPIIISYFLEFIIVGLQIISALLYPWPKTPFDSMIVLFGICIYAVGFFLAIWAKVTMKQIWGAPTEVTMTRQNKLIIAGPFRFSRNPIYTGVLLLFFGYAVALRSWFIFLRVPLIFYFIKSVRQEEKNLEKNFGKEYLAYKSRVPRFLFI